MNKITKQIETTVIHSASVTLQDGKPSINAMPAITVFGKKGQKRCENIVKSEFKDRGIHNNIIVTNIEYKSDLYSCDIEKFVEISEKIEKEKK